MKVKRTQESRKLNLREFTLEQNDFNNNPSDLLNEEWKKYENEWK